MRHTAKLPPFTIASGQTASNAFVLDGVKKHLSIFEIMAPAGMTGTELTIQVSDTKVPSDWYDYEEAGAVKEIAAGETAVVGPIGGRAIRVVSQAAEGADRSVPLFAVLMGV